MQKGTEKVKSSLYLDKEIFAKLEALSERTLIPKSRLIRRGIELVIKEYEQRKRFEPQGTGPG